MNHRIVQCSTTIAPQCSVQRLFGELLLFFLALVGVLNNLSANAIAPPPICANLAATEIGGMVFQDTNYNGVLDGGEQGVESIGVNIYSTNGQLLSSLLTNTDGEYSFDALTPGITYRVVYFIPTTLSHLAPTLVGDENQSNVQFVEPGNCSSFGVANVADFCVANPLVVTTCYIKGLANGEAVVTNNYELDGTSAYPCDAAEVGSTFGLAYQRSTGILFTAAFVKSKVGLGSEGIDAIYMIDPTGGCFKDPTNTHFNLSDFGCDAGTTPPICATSPSDDPTCRDLVADPAAPTYDTWGWNNQFKTGLGDIDISEDGNTLYVMNLEGNGEVVILDVADPYNPALIGKVAVPDPGCAAPTDVRPFATKVYNGELYIGITCSAESTQDKADLKAFVYKLNTAGTAFTQVVIDGSTTPGAPTDHIRLDYDRSGAFDAAFYADGDFLPWTDNPADYAVVNTYLTRPMPLLTDIEFDNDGSMMLAFANRDAYTVGEDDIFPGGPSNPGVPSVGPLVAGELLRVCNAGGSFVLEGGAACPSNMSGVDNLGPGGGEFYWGENAAGIHFETTMGALAMLPGSEFVVMTFMDAGGLNTGGLHRLSNTTGSKLPFAGSNGLTLYADGPGEFSKGSGLGDLEIICPLPPIQVGNYVWFDEDGDGFQDPEEAPAIGFTVKLYSKPAAGAPVLLETTTTGLDGSYYFTVDSGTDYFLVFCGDNNADGLITFEGMDYNISPDNQGMAVLDDAFDSDATVQSVGGTLVPAICIYSGSTTNHSYDVGIIAAIPAVATVGNFAFLDCNENGIQDAGDSPLPNVPVTLNGTGVSFSTSSNAAGFYEFVDVPVGTYTIAFGFPVGVTGLAYAPANQGGDDSVDSDVLPSGSTAPFVLLPGDNNTNVDAGYNDVAPPVYVNMAMDETVECDGSGNLAALTTWLANYGGATATDNLTPVANLVWANDFIALSDDCGATGSTSITFTVTDECGNIASTTANFTIIDLTPPTITVPANITIECDAATLPANTGTATAMDVCSGAIPDVFFSDVSTQGMGCSAYSYTIIRTWSATDDCNNTATASQIITVEDNNPPVITPPADLTVQCDQPTDPGATGTAVASNDNCAPDGELTISFSDLSTQAPTGCGNDSYTITRTWVASDPCGNTSSAVQTITVVDTTPPTIFCPANTTIECDESTAPANTGAAIAVDNCAPLSEIVISFSDISTQMATGCGQYQYTITRTWSAADACGNASTCVQIINVEDTTPPAITCPANITIECDESTAPSNTGLAVSSGDNCSTVEEIAITFSDISTQTATGCGQYQYMITRTWMATDICGNTTTCVQIINIQDTTPPVISCPANLTLTCFETIPAPWTNAMDFVAGGGTVSDNCTATLPEFTVFTSNVDNGGTNCPGDARVVVRTYFVNDACGNTSTCEQTFTYLASTQGPVITSVLPACYKYCADLANPMESDITYETDCSFGATVSITGPTQIGALNCPGSILRYTYTVTDDCGRTSSPVTRDFIIGNDGPIIQCPPFNLLLECGDPNNSEYIATHIGTVTASASCDLGVTINYFPQNFSNIACASATVVTFVATDACGRTASCTTTISVMDNTAPVITSTYVDGICNEAICGSDINFWYNAWKAKVLEGLSATDDCDSNVSFTVVGPNSPAQDCPDGLTETVLTWVASDNCGNQSEISYSFFVVPADEPTPLPSIMGTIATETAATVEGVVITLSGNTPNGQTGNLTTSMQTTENGLFAFADLEEGANYEVTPVLDENPLNGISSYDLFLITRHVLGVQALDSPYKVIAADVNNSGSVSTVDVMELRNLILHNIDALGNNTSWRFVAADYVFPTPNNPFASIFPEAVFINGLSGEEQHDFVGIKVGDVNNNAVANGLMNGDSRDFKGDLILETVDKELEAGQSYEVTFHASNFTEMVGYQFSLNFDAHLLQFEEVRPEALTNLSVANFGLSKLSEGVITTSWHNNQAVTIMDKTPLFTLRFTATVNTLLSEALSVNSTYTVAEAYGKLAETNAIELLKVDFRFDGSELAGQRYVLHQNTPNPFHGKTVVGFNLPIATSATLSIYDMKGELVKQVEGEFEKGYHSVEFNKQDLGATGVYYYKLVTPKWSQTKKMVLVNW